MGVGGVVNRCFWGGYDGNSRKMPEKYCNPYVVLDLVDSGGLRILHLDGPNRDEAFLSIDGVVNDGEILPKELVRLTRKE